MHTDISLLYFYLLEKTLYKKFSLYPFLGFYQNLACMLSGFIIYYTGSIMGIIEFREEV